MWLARAAPLGNSCGATALPRCTVQVVGGAENLSPPTRSNRASQQQRGLSPDERLAAGRVKGPCEVRQAIGGKQKAESSRRRQKAD